MLGLEGIVSKRRDSSCRSGLSPDQEQEPNGAGREAGARGRLGPVTSLRAPARGRGSQRGTRSAHGNWGFWVGERQHY